MDIRKLLHLQPKQPAIDIDPAQGLPTGEFEIANSGDLRARAAENIAGISPMILGRAGEAREGLAEIPGPVVRRPRRATEDRPRERGTNEYESETSDLMKHMLGGMSDGRVRKVMKERRRHGTASLSQRRAA